MNGFWENGFIYVGDLTQKWEKISIWFESQGKSVKQVKRSSDLNQYPRNKKNELCDYSNVTKVMKASNSNHIY